VAHILANIIVFAMFVVVVGAVIVFARSLKKSCVHEHDAVNFEDDKLENVSKELYDKETEEISRATAGYGTCANSPYFVE